MRPVLFYTPSNSTIILSVEEYRIYSIFHSIIHFYEVIVVEAVPVGRLGCRKQHNKIIETIAPTTTATVVFYKVKPYF